MGVERKKEGVPMATNQKQRQFTPTANTAYIEAMRGIRGSSAASPQEDRRTRRARTRLASKRQSLKDWS